MLKKLYVHNYKSLQNFEFNLEGKSSVALLGKNGSGKSSIGEILYILQQIGNGETNIEKLILADDFSFYNKKKPITIQIEVVCKGKNLSYKLVIEYLTELNRIDIKEESLECENKQVFSRNLGAFAYYNKLDEKTSSDNIFLISHSFITLPLLQKEEKDDPINLFKAWLKNIILLAPQPSLIDGVSSNNSKFTPNLSVTNLGNWIVNILEQHPDTYSLMDDFLQIFMHSFKRFYTKTIAIEKKEIRVVFSIGKKDFDVPFNKLSDGEKCFFIGAALIATINYEKNLLCFWDEPDSYLGVSEIEHFIMTLRKGFKRFGQIILTSHNDEVLDRFPDESMYIVHRENHLSSSKIIQVSKSDYTGDKLFIQRQLGEI
jgi:ABC-type multidrug transport system ATPase subunit